MMRYLPYIALLVLFVPACAKRDAGVEQVSQIQPESQTSSQPLLPPDKLADRLPLDSHPNSPASLLKKNTDGTLLIKIKPRVYTSEMGCTMVSDEWGNTFSQLYDVIAFSIQSKHYYTIWGVRYGKGPALTFDREKEYRFLVKPYREAEFKNEIAHCEIIKAWDTDNNVVFEKQGKKKIQSKDLRDKI